MSTFWNPRSVLDINPSEKGFCCTAIITSTCKRGIPQDGPRRCQQHFLKSESKEKAGSMLDDLGCVDVVVADTVGEDVAKILVRIAELTMCPQLHQKPGRSQAEQVGKKWLRLVVNHAAAVRLGRQRKPRQERGDAPPALVQEEASVVRQAARRSAPGARDTRVDIRPSPVPVRVAPVIPARNPAREPAVAPSVEPRRPAVRGPYVPQRQSLADDCFICCEPFETGQEVVWCKKQCGKNVHADCFEAWTFHKGRRECGAW
ncbi:hypothetical protein BUE80_DR000575 [Diplocarpon rosae]|nr:hypothetical protein BUE80_DR000575 [Diplocarpon rosae]